jgi:diacylglycerol kinase (ATP)
MKFKNIHFIINPASSKEEPILFFINKIFNNSDTEWDVSIIKKNRNAWVIAKKLIGKTDLVVVYGGDGCVTEVASALHGTKTPMAIIPAGTANVMAKELGISSDTKEALVLLKTGSLQLKAVDMGLMNGHPFLLRVNLGIMADMVSEADRDLKNNIGQLAYGVTAIKTIANAEKVKYHLKIDGKIIEEAGVCLTITNCGNVGIGDFKLQPGISITDGLLDVILMEDNDISSVLKIAGNTALQQETTALKHWKCKKVVLTLDKPQTFICDDAEHTAKKLTIKVVPASIKIAAPISK